MLKAILAGLVCVALGAFLLLKPDLYWRLTERWKSYYADEPSDIYIRSTKLGGVLFALIGVAIIIAYFVLE